MLKRRQPPSPPVFPFPFVVGEDAATAYAVIREEHPAEAAPVFQQLLHEVRMWLAAPAMERRVLGSAPDPDFLPVQLRERVRRIFAMLREEPDAHTAQGIALGLTLVGDWFEGEGRAIRSAVVFYQATLLTMPGNVPVAYHIGRLLRRVALYDESEAWLLYVVDVAARSRQWEYHTLALSGLGNLKRERGNRPDAVCLHRLVLKAAREGGLQRLEGDALYDLAVMHFDGGQIEEGMSYARDAMKVYGPGHSQLVRMANDIGWIWMHVHGEAELALVLFQAIEPRVQEPAFRSVLLANLARAAAEVGEEKIYELSWLEAFAYMRRQDTEAGHAAAFSQLALASIAVLQLERARLAASLSLDIAQRRRERRLTAMAENIYDAIREGMPTPERMKGLFPAFTLEEFATDSAEVERNRDFASSLGSALRAREDGGPESPVRALICGR